MAKKKSHGDGNNDEEESLTAINGAAVQPKRVTWNKHILGPGKSYTYADVVRTGKTELI